ncbi:MAG TPA: hypothetical protein PKM15_00415 [bacterium]|nr:hypothetical protein [bacterium]
MKNFFSVIFITIFFVACSSGKSSINDEDIATGETKDENQQLPTSDDEPGEVEDDMSDDLSDDMSDEALAESEATNDDTDLSDEALAESDEDDSPLPDEDTAFYEDKCDCFGSEYTIPEQFRGIDGWCKQDADSDGLPNCIEAVDGELTNSDSDADPDYLDTDSDDDGIPDSIEGLEDIDKDGIPNYRDTDSDGDGYSDSAECPTLPCRDTDGDSIPDYVDFDSDNDGLTDKEENDLNTDPLEQDSDDDGFDDLSEIAYGSDPLDKADGIPEDDFYVKLPFEAPADEIRILKFKTNVEKADVLILFDLSDSMSQESTNVKNGISSEIIGGISANITDVAFGLATFDDWKGLSRYSDPTEGTNYSGTGTLQHTDSIFSLVQPVTTDMSEITGSINGIQTGSLCGWEPHHEALYQVATGAGYTGDFYFETTYVSTNKCDVVGNYIPEIPAANCTGHEGNIGGGCFRNDAMPIIIMLSDEAFTNFGAHFTWNIPYHTTEEAIAALNAINAKFIGIDSWSEETFWTTAPENDFKAISTATGSVDATTGDPFFYKIGSDGTGLSDQIADAVFELTTNIKLDVWTARESVANPELVDTSLFIKALIPDSSDPVNAYFSKDTTTFYLVNPGAKVNFEIKFHNDFYEPDKAEATVFRAKINVLGDGALLDTREVVILVPGIHSRDN